MTLQDAQNIVSDLKSQVKKVLFGQDEVLDQVLISLLASGHVLVEGLPGLGKTLMVRALAKAFGGQSQRVQFTPDLMPGDLTGHSTYEMSTGKFITRQGPVFTHLLIADEINRAPAKTQSALLEVMQEYQVTLDGVTTPLERPFLVLATQNPFESEGTYPLPDAQLDRFLIKVTLTYPDREHEVAMVTKNLSNHRGDNLDLTDVQTVTTPQRLSELQDYCATISVHPNIVDYAVRLVEATRKHHGVLVGAGPRSSLALIRLARARAVTEGRDFTTPADVKALAVGVFKHRIVLNAEWELGGGSVEAAVGRILETVEAPRE